MLGKIGINLPNAAQQNVLHDQRDNALEGWGIAASRGF